jgi:hypothetical protein
MDITDRASLIRKLERMLDDAAREHTYGSIEIQLSDGMPALLRQSSTEKLLIGERNRERNNHQRT